MTAYHRYHAIEQHATSAQEAKAKRQAVLARVRKQRAAAYKRTVADWMDEGLLMPASELKERYCKKHSSKLSQDIG